MPLIAIPWNRRVRIDVYGVLLLLLLATGCASRPASDGKQVVTVGKGVRGQYAVHFEASRLQDHVALAAVTVPVRVGQRATVHMRSQRPTERTPTFTAFTAALSATRTPGAFQLVTKVAMREAARNKKGKLKYSKRNQGALLPMRAGETQLASTPNDPVQINIRLERR